MYNAGMITKGLSLTKIIGGLSKTLQIANQVIPLYQKAKPMISNAKSLFSIVKEMGKSNKEESTTQPQTIENNINNTTNASIKKENTTSPTFFL